MTKTPTACLRPLDAIDVPAVAKGYREQVDLHLFTTGFEVGASDSAAKEYVEQAISERQARTAFRYGLWEADRDLIGVVELHKINWIHRRCEIGIQIWNADNRKRGLGRQGLEQILQIGDHRLGLQRSAAIVNSDNLASLRLFRSAGFLDEGVMRDYMFVEGRFLDAIILGRLRASNGS